MKRFNTLILAFAFAFAIFVLGPPFLGYTFGPYPLMKVADVFDLLTPLVLIPLYWLLFRLRGSVTASLKENLAFIVLAAFWVLGKGMHLTANSIGHLAGNLAGTDIYNLTTFYDERLGHYLWHFGAIGLSALLIYRQWKNPFAERAFDWKIVLAGIIYGFTFFAGVIEGATWPMGLPFAVLAVIFILVWARKDLARQPLVALFLIGNLVALVLSAVWGIWQHGLPEFSKVGFL